MRVSLSPPLSLCFSFTRAVYRTPSRSIIQPAANLEPNPSYLQRGTISHTISRYPTIKHGLRSVAVHRSLRISIVRIFTITRYERSAPATHPHARIPFTYLHRRRYVRCSERCNESEERNDWLLWEENLSFGEPALFRDSYLGIFRRLLRFVRSRAAPTRCNACTVQLYTVHRRLLCTTRPRSATRSRTRARGLTVAEAAREYRFGTGHASPSYVYEAP